MSNRTLIFVALGVFLLWQMSRARASDLKLIPTDLFGTPISSRTAKPLERDTLSTYTNREVVQPSRETLESETVEKINPSSLPPYLLYSNK